MAFLWTNKDEIESYLDDDVSKYVDEAADLMSFENEAVYDIATFLSMAFVSSSETLTDAQKSPNGSTPLGFSSSNCPGYLSLLAAKYAVTKVAMKRMGSSLARLPNWVRQGENDIFAQLRRLVLNAETAGLEGLTVRPDYDVNDILIKMKTRNQAVMETID